jgi:hypothetical protein
MSDSIVPARNSKPNPSAGAGPLPGPDQTPEASEAFHRFTARLATLDLDPPTVEILTAVLTVDLDLDTGPGDPPR